MSTSVPPITVASLPDHPVQFDVEYPDRELDRLTTFFRPIVAIPILVVLGLVLGGNYGATTDTGTAVIATGGGLLVLPTVLMIVFRRKYWQARVAGYATLLVTDRYPPFSLR